METITKTRLTVSRYGGLGQGERLLKTAQLIAQPLDVEWDRLKQVKLGGGRLSDEVPS